MCLDQDATSTSPTRSAAASELRWQLAGTVGRRFGGSSESATGPGYRSARISNRGSRDQFNRGGRPSLRLRVRSRESGLLQANHHPDESARERSSRRATVSSCHASSEQRGVYDLLIESRAAWARLALGDLGKLLPEKPGRTILDAGCRDAFAHLDLVESA